MALSGCYGVLKWIVFIVNLIFWLAGVGVLALSIWLLFDQAVVFMAKGAQDYATGTYILLAAGALMTVIGFLGCCGALRESQCLLGTFFVFLMIILVAEIAGGVWAYMNRAELNKLVQESVRDTVRRDYGKDDVTTKTFDMIQKTLKCCGAESYASWANSAYNGVGEKSQMEIGISALSPTYSVPKSCCADPDSDVCETTRKLGSLGFAASALGIVYTDGCAPKLEALLQQYLTYVSATGIGIGIIEHEPNNEHLNRADLNKLVQERMRHAVRRDYGKDDVTTKTFDMIQRTLKCCGAESYASWANSAYNGVDEKSQMEIGISALSPTYSVPKSCCADPDTDLCETTRKLGSLGFAASALGIVYTDGCAPKLEALLQQYFTYVFATGTGIGFGIIEHEPNNEHMNRADLNKPGIGIIELLGMIFSMLLCCAIRKI